MSKLSEELKLWAGDDIVPSDLQALCKKAADCHDELVAIKKTIQDESDKLDTRIAGGKHDDAWPNPKYIKDEDWARMIGEERVYHYVLSLFETALEKAKVK